MPPPPPFAQQARREFKLIAQKFDKINEFLVMLCCS